MAWGREDSESFQARSGALRKKAVICDDFMTHFLSYFAIICYLGCPLLVVDLPGYSRLRFSVVDDTRAPLLLRIRKQVFQQRGLQTSFFLVAFGSFSPPRRHPQVTCL